MSSGKYSALSGALTRLRMMDSISDNLANNKTVGFKRSQVAFEALLADSLSGRSDSIVSRTEIREGFTDYSQGPLIRTEVPTHVAIDGEGFFKVQDEEGNLYYTRQGNFHIDETGVLTSSTGMKVLGDNRKPIILPSPDVTIDERGNILLQGGETIKLPVYTFSDGSVMNRKGGGLFTVSEADIKEFESPVADPQIVQGQIEDSNVNMMQEMGKMIEAMRAFEACQKMLKNYSTIENKAIELGRLG
jgi:flagellar basal-body rod protein FlgF/flagellar basal-body rod protein FlgG